jgi:septal ring factor EnvC (AmiA/AmiB activator)
MGNGKHKIKSKLLLTSYFLLLIFHFSLLTSHFSLTDASDPKKELQEIEKRLSEEKRKVKQTIKEEKSILSELDQINKLLRKKREELKYYDTRLSETRSKIIVLENEISVLNEKLQIRKNLLKERLRSLYKQRHGDIAFLLFSAKDYQDLIKKSRYISFIAYYDNKLLHAYSDEIENLNIKMKRLGVLQKELEVNKDNVKKKTEEIQAEREKKDNLLASIKNKRSSYEKMIKELEESSKRLYEMIEKLGEQESPPQVAGKGFKALKGHLPWPISGKVLVPYGKQKDPNFNIPTFKKGVEIKANTGDPVRAVSEGRVVYADWFKGYGLLLIINHGGGYHTLYAHLSETFHKIGDIIKGGQTVGKIGESGLLNEPSLYFEIRHKGKPLNPLEWLRRK